MRGRKPNLKEIERAHKLKGQGLNVSEIARVMKKHRRQVQRYLKIDPATLSTPSKS